MAGGHHYNIRLNYFIDLVSQITVSFLDAAYITITCIMNRQTQEELFINWSLFITRGSV